MTVAAAKEEQEEVHQQQKDSGGIDNNNNTSNVNTTSSSGLDVLINIAKEKEFEIEQQNKDYGAGPIDLVLNIEIHPALPKIKCGFIVLRAEEGGGTKDWQDNQYSLRKIEEA
ncbi:MAG: hypothetical protein ACJ72S_07745, partial [Nitrososphaeraceae archaeon]